MDYQFQKNDKLEQLVNRLQIRDTKDPGSLNTRQRQIFVSIPQTKVEYVCGRVYRDNHRVNYIDGSGVDCTPYLLGQLYKRRLIYNHGTHIHLTERGEKL